MLSGFLFQALCVKPILPSVRLRGSGDPAFGCTAWIPAYAGMNGLGQLQQANV